MALLEDYSLQHWDTILAPYEARGGAVIIADTVALEIAHWTITGTIDIAIFLGLSVYI